MNIVYKKELNKNYLVLEKTEEASEFAIHMLEENKIQGLLPFEKRSFNGEESFYYDISGKYTLENLAKMRPLEEADIKGFLEGLLFTMQTCSSYFLDVSGLSLEFDLIYESEGLYSFCYYPMEKESRQDMEEKLKIFAEKLIGLVNHDDEQAVTLVYQFYRLAKENTCTAVQILQKLLEAGQNDIGQNIINQNIIRQNIIHQNEINQTEINPKAKWSSVDEAVSADKDSLYDFSYEADKENKHELKDEKGGKEEKEIKPDYLTVIIFLILAVGSISYFVYRFMTAEAFSLEAELSCREGLLAAVFLVLSLPGMFLSFFLERESMPIFRGLQH